MLEDGCPDDEESEEYKKVFLKIFFRFFFNLQTVFTAIFQNILKVSFIGISNWALDPAKMNRGILLQREIPDEKDLIESAKYVDLIELIRSILNSENSG